MRNERTPRTLAETTFYTGYPLQSARRHWLREVPAYAAFLGFLALVLFGLPALAHFVARFA